MYIFKNAGVRNLEKAVNIVEKGIAEGKWGLAWVTEAKESYRMSLVELCYFFIYLSCHFGDFAYAVRIAS